MKDSSYLFTLFGIVSFAGCSSAPGANQNGSAVGTGGTVGNAGTSGSGVPGGNTSSGGGSASVGNGTGGTAQPGSGGATTTGANTSTAGTNDASSGATATAGATATGSAGTESGGTNAGGALSTAGTAQTGGAPDNGGGAASVGGATSAGGATTIPIDKFIGNIAPKNQEIPADFASKWMQMSMEANSKWGFVQPDSADGWVWEPVDEAHQYGAADNGIIFKQHTFFWNFEQPSWVTASNVATAGPAWMQAFCDRYPDIAQIDVVNEPIHNKAPYREGMGGDGESGYDWVVTAYQWAREACPNAVLIINEFNIVEWEDDHNWFIESLHAILDAGAPIDAIGAQGHDIFDAGADQAKIYIDALTAEFNLPIYITELDINLSDDQEQLASMQAIIPMLWDHPNVYGITYWGFLQGKTWRPNAWLVSTSGTERPAMTWLQEFIASHR